MSTKRSKPTIMTNKLYNLHVNNYGENWFVCARSRQAAAKAFVDGINRDRDAERDHLLKEYKDHGWPDNDDKQQRLAYIEECRQEQIGLVHKALKRQEPWAGAGKPAQIDEIEPLTPVFSEIA